MDLDKNQNIVSYDPDTKQRETIPKDNVDAMDSILDRLRDVNKDNEVWDKLSGLENSKMGYALFYRKKKDD